MTMWQMLRKEYSDKTLQDIADEFGVTVSAISQFETGRRSMPTKMKIYYLKLRNNEKDKIIIEYIKEIEELKLKNEDLWKI